ncbi:hypothetical protein LSAT2_018965 [Lamellibrachia satsuma]|nr:hypothetical protein LSAT2_018965 [Lamellibrachia satsuma]
MDDYKVSFNSDTSDSEEEESRPTVKAPPAANGIGENGDASALNGTTEDLGQNGRIKQVNKATIESNDVGAKGMVPNDDARSKCSGINGNIEDAEKETNGESGETENRNGRTVISAKDGILSTGSEVNHAAVNHAEVNHAAVNHAAANIVCETSDAESSKNGSASSTLEETTGPGCLLARGGPCFAEEDIAAQQVRPHNDTSDESNILENGDQLVPDYNSASIDLGKLGAFKLSTGLSSDPGSENNMPYKDQSSDDMIKTTSSTDNEISAAAEELSPNVSRTDTDKANDNKVGNVAECHVSGGNVDSTDTAPTEAASIYTGRGTDDKQPSSDETMADYRRSTDRPMDETEQLIQRILAEAKLEAAGDSSVKEKTVGAERTRSVSRDREQSLLDRRGLDSRLGNLFSGDDRRDLWDDSSYEDQPNWAGYRGRTDVKSMRNRFRDNGRQYEQGTYRDSDNFYVPYAGGRCNDDDEEEVVFEDSEFEPQRREETEELVREKTSDIRSMVDKQATVLQKLKEASESFDDISKEIRAMKQDFLETQYRRSFAMDDDDYEQPSYYSYQPDSYRRDVSRLSSSYSSTYESPYAKPSVSLDPELESDLPVAHRSLGSLASTWAYPSSRTQYDTSYYPSTASRYTTGTSYSRSLFDNDNGDLDSEDRYSSYLAKTPREDDDNSSINGRSYSFESSTSAAATALPSYRSKYGYIPTQYSSTAGRYAGSLSRARTLPDATEHSGFKSRFLSKVRDQKGDEPKSPKRDKPFKSRFLRKSRSRPPSETPTTRNSQLTPTRTLKLVSRFCNKGYSCPCYPGRVGVKA